MTTLVLFDLESEDTIIFRNVSSYISSVPINITLLDPEEEGMMIFETCVVFDQLTRRNIPEDFTIRVSIKLFNVSKRI